MGGKQVKNMHKVSEKTVKTPGFDGKCGEIYHVLTGRGNGVIDHPAGGKNQK